MFMLLNLKPYMRQTHSQKNRIQEIETLNNPITIKEIECVNENLPTY